MNASDLPFNVPRPSRRDRACRRGRASNGSGAMAAIFARGGAEGVSGAAIPQRSAFSLAELMVAVSLLTVVVLALYSVFNQTQKAFRASLNQVDVDEAARSAMELISRDIEQAAVAGFRATPTNGTVITNLVIRYDGQFPIVSSNLLGYGLRESAFHELFYWVRSREQPYSFEPRGYFVAPETLPAEAVQGSDLRGLRPFEGIGTLYRFDGFPTEPVSAVTGRDLNGFTNRPAPRQAWASRIVNAYFQWPLDDVTVRAGRTNAARVIEGVVLFRVIPCDASGRALDPAEPWLSGGALEARNLRQLLVSRGVDLGLAPNGNRLNSTLKFARDSLPTFLDLELGVLDPATLSTLRSLPAAVRGGFIQRNLGKIQIFRQRIHLRAAPPLP